ncbi:MAG: Na+/H+ antiporter subunit E [Phycisphaerales bacterium]
MMLAANIVLALVWAIMLGSLSLLNLGVGFVAGYLVLVAVGGGRSDYVRRTSAGGALFVFTCREIIIANLRVAWYTISSLKSLEPAVLAVPLAPDLSDGEITLLSLLVTLTPGTLSIDLSRDRRSLYVHFMHVDDAEEAIRSITDGFERRILELR